MKSRVLEGSIKGRVAGHGDIDFMDGYEVGPRRKLSHNMLLEDAMPVASRRLMMLKYANRSLSGNVSNDPHLLFAP
jgi:hypothetical protein